MAQRTSKPRRADKGGPTSGPGLTDYEGEDVTLEPSPADAINRARPLKALSMALPGTRLDMVVGGPHPRLIELVRHLARAAAQDEQATWAATLNARQTPGGCESEEI